MFTGELQKVSYQDEVGPEQLAALNDDTEIDDILMQASDPFQDIESDSNEGF